MDDFYSLQNDDIKLVQGDTVNLEYEFVDEDNNPIDISSYHAQFFVKHPETNALISMLHPITQYSDDPIDINDFSKERNDAVLGGRGIFFMGDIQISGSAIPLSKNNQLVIVLESEDTSSLEYGMSYPFEIKLDQHSGERTIVVIRGFLLVAKGLSV